MSLNDLQKALDEVEAIVWATCEFGSLGREKMNVLVNLFSVFQKENVIVSRNQLSDLIDSIPIDLEKVGSKYECYSIGTKKQWTEWFVRYNLILQGKELLEVSK
jgi:hypothetical protein